MLAMWIRFIAFPNRFMDFLGSLVAFPTRFVDLLFKLLLELIIPTCGRQWLLLELLNRLAVLDLFCWPILSESCGQDFQ